MFNTPQMSQNHHCALVMSLPPHALASRYLYVLVPDASGKTDGKIPHTASHGSARNGVDTDPSINS
jgi:hypothetical protein